MRWLPLLLATGCATDPSTGSSGTGKADGDEAELTFAGDFSESLRGTLHAGGDVAITYALERMTSCRGYTNGSDAWGVGGYAQFDDGAPVAFAVSQIVNHQTRPETAQLHIPATATRVQIWFEQTDVFGCHAYDSNESANYAWDVAAPTTGAVLAFGDTVDTPEVHAGDQVTLHYDPSRLSACATGTVTGSWQVDGGAVHALVVARKGEATDPTFVVPRGDDLAIWFEVVDQYGCHAYDSANGANYHVAID